MSAASHQPANATNNAGVPPAPSATRQGAGDQPRVIKTYWGGKPVVERFDSAGRAAAAYVEATSAARHAPHAEAGRTRSISLHKANGAVLASHHYGLNPPPLGRDRLTRAADLVAA